MGILIRAFEAVGIEEASHDARLLLCEAAGIDHSALIRDPESPLEEAAHDRLLVHAGRRLAREPVTRILGSRGFWSLDILVAPDVLDPRPDSEALVDAALKVLGDRQNEPLRIADLGSGSGAILCALLDAFPAATGLAVDISPAACVLTTRNLQNCGMMARSRVVNQSWTALADAEFDLIVSNPPYIPSPEIQSLDPEVRDFDPRLALDGGSDGLAAYRDLAATLPGLLAPEGIGIVELGWGQAADATAIFQKGVLRVVDIQKDLSGVERAAILKKIPPRP